MREIRPRRARVFVCAALCAAVGCRSAPVDVERADPKSVHRELTANVLSTGRPSPRTMQLLERSLGYAGQAFAPATGRVLRIVQTGPVADRDGFGNIVELATARQAGDTGANEVPPGWRLGIVEADFHGPATRPERGAGE